MVVYIQHLLFFSGQGPLPGPSAPGHFWAGPVQAERLLQLEEVLGQSQQCCREQLWVHRKVEGH